MRDGAAGVGAEEVEEFAVLDGIVVDSCSMLLSVGSMYMCVYVCICVYMCVCPLGRRGLGRRGGCGQKAGSTGDEERG